MYILCFGRNDEIQQTFVRCFLRDRDSTSIRGCEHHIGNSVVSNSKLAISIPFIFCLRYHRARIPEKGAIHISKQRFPFGIANHVYTIRWIHFTRGEKGNCKNTWISYSSFVSGGHLNILKYLMRRYQKFLIDWIWFQKKFKEGPSAYVISIVMRHVFPLCWFGLLWIH